MLIGLVLSLVASWVVADVQTRPLILNTVIFAGGSALITLPVGLLAALYLRRSTGWSRRLLLLSVTLMLFLPGYLHVAGWEAGFGMQGWFCRWCFPTEPYALLAGWRGAIWVQSFINLPWMVLILGIGLATVPREQEELGRLDAKELDVIRFVTIPQLRPAIFAAILWCSVMAAGEITVTDVYRVRTFAEELYMGFALGDDLESAPQRNFPGSLLTLGIAASAMIACQNVSRNLQSLRFRSSSIGGGHRLPHGLTILVASLALIAIAVPVASLVIQAGLEVVAVGEERVRQWSAQKLGSMLLDFPSRFGHEFAWSFVLGQMTSITVTLIALVAAFLAKRSRIAAAVAWSFTLIGLAVPGTITALAIGRLVNQPNNDWLFFLYDRTLFVPWITLSLKLFPYAFVVASWMVSRVNRRPIESTLLDTESPLLQLWYGWLPQLWQPIAWLWVLMLSMSVADLSATILAVPPGVTTVAIRIFNLVHYGVGDQLAALCLGTMTLFAAFALTITFFLPIDFESSRR